MILTKNILDEKDKRIRKISTDVTFPLEDKYKKFINDSIQMLTLSQIEEEAEKYNLRPGMGLSAVQVGILKRIFKELHKERQEIPGCKERIDFKFIKYVITYNKTKRHLILDNIKDMPNEKILIFKKQKDLNNWLKKFTQNEDILNGIK